MAKVLPKLVSTLKKGWPVIVAAVLMAVVMHLALPLPTAGAAVPASAQVVAARLSGTDTRTRFIADLDRAVSYSVYVIDQPYRVVVDLRGVSFNMRPDIGDEGMGLVTSFRFGQLGGGKSRIVIDTTGPVLIEKSFVLNPENGQPARMVIDIIQTDQRTFARVKATELPGSPAPQPVGQADNEASRPDTLADLLAREGVAPIEQEAAAAAAAANSRHLTCPDRVPSLSRVKRQPQNPNNPRPRPQNPSSCWTPVTAAQMVAPCRGTAPSKRTSC